MLDTLGELSRWRQVLSAHIKRRDPYGVFVNGRDYRVFMPLWDACDFPPTLFLLLKQIASALNLESLKDSALSNSLCEH